MLLEAIVAAQHRCNFMPFISLFDESILSSRQAARSSGESARRRQVRVDLAPDIRRGEACDFRNRFRVQTLEIRHDHLAVERIELLDQSEQSAERLARSAERSTSSEPAWPSVSSKVRKVPTLLPLAWRMTCDVATLCATR